MTKGNSKIRLLITTPHLSTTSNPFGHIYNIVKYLPKDRFEVTIGVLRYSDEFEDISKALLALGVKEIIKASIRPKRKGLIFHYRTLRDSFKFYGKYDLQHSWDYSSWPYEALFARLQGRKFIYTQRNMIEKGVKSLYKLRFRLANGIMAISKACEDLVINQGIDKRKVKVINIGIDAEYLEERLATVQLFQRPYFLFVGHILRRKRHKDAILAVLKLKDEFPELKLLIAGDNYEPDYMDELNHLVMQYNAEQQVIFLGRTSDIATFLHQANAAVLCSENEAMGRSVLEAMALKTPVIASNIDGIKEIVQNEKTGLLVEVGDVEGYTNAMRRILQDLDFARKLAKQASDYFDENLTAKIMTKNLVMFYEDVMAGKV